MTLMAKNVDKKNLGKSDDEKRENKRRLGREKLRDRIDSISGVAFWFLVVSACVFGGLLVLYWFSWLYYLLLICIGIVGGFLLYLVGGIIFIITMIGGAVVCFVINFIINLTKDFENPGHKLLPKTGSNVSDISDFFYWIIKGIVKITRLQSMNRAKHFYGSIYENVHSWFWLVSVVLLSVVAVSGLLWGLPYLCKGYFKRMGIEWDKVCPKCGAIMTTSYGTERATGRRQEEVYVERKWVYGYDECDGPPDVYTPKYGHYEGGYHTTNIIDPEREAIKEKYKFKYEYVEEYTTSCAECGYKFGGTKREWRYK